MEDSCAIHFRTLRHVNKFEVLYLILVNLLSIIYGKHVVSKIFTDVKEKATVIIIIIGRGSGKRHLR